MMIKDSPIYVFKEGIERVKTIIEVVHELNKKAKNSKKRVIIKNHIVNLVELLFPAFVSALEQYYKNKLIEKLSKSEFRDVFIINRNKFSKVLNEFEIKDDVLDEMLDHGWNPRLINLGNYIEENRRLNFQDFKKQVKNIYQLVFEVDIKNNYFFREMTKNKKKKTFGFKSHKEYVWQEIIRIKRCRDKVIHSDGKIKQNDLKYLSGQGKDLSVKEDDIGKSVAELFIDWNNKRLLDRLNNIVLATQHYVERLDKYIDDLEIKDADEIKHFT